MANVGYIRVSAADQNTARQLAGINLERTFVDKFSGKDTKRPQLQECLAWLREGDTLHVHSIDRLARSLSDLLEVLSSLKSRGVNVCFKKENMQFNAQEEKGAMCTLQLQILGAFAEFERSLIKERQKEGIEAARAAGKHVGRPAKLTGGQLIELTRRFDAGESATKLSKEFGVSRASVYRLKQQATGEVNNATATAV